MKSVWQDEKHYQNPALRRQSRMELYDRRKTEEKKKKKREILSGKKAI